MESAKKKNLKYKYKNELFIIKNQTYYFLQTLLGKKLTSYFLKSGKISQSHKFIKIIFLKFYYEIKYLKKFKKNQLKLFKIILLKLIPFFETRNLKRSGSLHVISLPVYNKKRRFFLAIKFLKKVLKKKKLNKFKRFNKYIAHELINLYIKRGILYTTLKSMKETIYKCQTYLHYRWE